MQEARPGWIELNTTLSHGAKRAGVPAGLPQYGSFGDRSSDRLGRPRVVKRSIASAR